MSAELTHKTGIKEWPTLAGTPKEERAPPFDPPLSAASSVSDSSASDVSQGASSSVHSSREEQKIRDAQTTYYPHPTPFTLSERPIDAYRQLKVAVVGAGLSGVSAAALLPVKVPRIRLTVFEKNADVGGTWLENAYPGVRCDIPAHVYQSSFEPNTQWSEEYAQGAEIRAYWQRVARKYGVYERLRLRTKVTGSYWEERRAQWRLEIEDAGGERETLYFDFVVHAIGRFNSWRLPEYPGMEKFEGPLFHSSNYDQSFDHRGKAVATIGNGASGIQITPALQKECKRVDHYVRSPTWVAGAFTPWLKARQEGPMLIPELIKEEFKNEDVYLTYRKKLEGGFYRVYAGQIAESDASKAIPAKLTALMKERLGGGEKPPLIDELLPDFPPNCRRLTPGPGYLESLLRDNVELIRTPISHFTEDGIVTQDGTHRKVDAIICSTGANTNCAPPVPIVSGDIDLSRDWKPIEKQPDSKFGFPYSYFGVGVPGFPNMSFILGPNPAGPTGTLVNAAETQIAYIAKMLRKISTQGIRTMAPSKAAADDFVEYCDAFFPRTNLTRKCSSWSNSGIPGSRIHGHWPGSAAHLTEVRREPRYAYRQGCAKKSEICLLY